MTESIISDQLVIELVDDGGALVLALSGELDIASAPRLKGSLDEAETAAGRRLVIDLSGLQFMDSTGLHLLLEANRRWRENGRELSLRKGPRAVHRVFELTQTTSTFRFDG